VPTWDCCFSMAGMMTMLARCTSALQVLKSGPDKLIRRGRWSSTVSSMRWRARYRAAYRAVRDDFRTAD